MDIRVFSWSWGEGKMGIEGLTRDEMLTLEEAINEASWIAVSAGRLEHRSRFEPLPSPIEDPLVGPHWPKGQPPIIPNLEDLPRGSCPSISIQHLCGYNWTSELYRQEAAKLESWGFDCLRSRRSPDGMAWEIWRLPSLSFAKGDLLKALPEAFEEKPQAALKFLIHNVEFGSLEMSIQRACMVVD